MDIPDLGRDIDLNGIDFERVGDADALQEARDLLRQSRAEAMGSGRASWAQVYAVQALTSAVVALVEYLRAERERIEC